MKMRKTLTLAIALLMLATLWLPSATLAENTVYTSSTDGYQVAYPDNWTLLSKDTIDSVMTQLTEGNIEGIDANAFAMYKTQIESMDMIAVVSDTGLFNFNVIYQALPMQINSELAIAQLCPATIIQLKSAFGDIDVTDSGSVATVGENEYVHMAANYELNNVAMIIEQYMFLADKKLYVLTFTNTGAELSMGETIQDILTSFVPT